MGAEGYSGSQPRLDKPPSTPEMSARDAEAMANAMLLDSPLPNLERAMRKSQRMAEARGFQEKEKETEKVRSFLREVMINNLWRPL